VLFECDSGRTDILLHAKTILVIQTLMHDSTHQVVQGCMGTDVEYRDLKAYYDSEICKLNERIGAWKSVIAKYDHEIAALRKEKVRYQ
jgi:hypothetical protein